MAKKQRRKFETGFKKQLVSQIQSGEISPTEAARTHNISPTVISYWRRQFETGQLSELPSLREKELEKELGQYKKLLAEAHREIDNLKKARALREKLRKLNSSVITGLDLAQSKKGAGK